MEKNIVGLIKMGQLKRIQRVLHRNMNLENQFENRNWKEEISYILKGRGQYIPVNLDIDSIEDDLEGFLNSDLVKQQNSKNSIYLKRKIQIVLKLLVIQKTNQTLSKPK